MDREERLEILKKLDEMTLTKKFLIPLYSDGMGCKNVQYTHGLSDSGRDIIYCTEDEYGNPVYTGVQVKTTKITARNINVILCQIIEALGNKFIDFPDGKEKELDRIVIITSNEFTREARKSLWNSLKGASPHLQRLVTLIDGNKLVDLFDKYLPSVLWKEEDIPLNIWEDVLLEFKRMLEEPSLLEEDFKRFFIKNPWLIGVGLNYEGILPEERLGAHLRVDLLLKRYDGYFDIMELKRHTDDIIVSGDSGWKLNSKCESSIWQIYRYIEYCGRNVANEYYESGKNIYKPHGFVVIGQTTSDDIRRKLRLINDQYHSIEILTYDDLYEKAKRLIETARQLSNK